jgi:hypothetical protein
MKLVLNMHLVVSGSNGDDQYEVLILAFIGGKNY